MTNASSQDGSYNIVVFKYLPPLAVHLSLLGMEVSICIQSVVHNGYCDQALGRNIATTMFVRF